MKLRLSGLVAVVAAALAAATALTLADARSHGATTRDAAPSHSHSHSHGGHGGHARHERERERGEHRERAPSPETFGLRPDPLDAFQFSLAEPHGRQFDPRPRDLNATALLLRLGAHFDPRYMSVHRPPNATQLGFPFRHQRGGGGGGGGNGGAGGKGHGGGGGGGGRLAPAPGAEMPPFLRRMNFRWLKLPNGTRVRTHVSPRLQKKLQHFLWAWTACPVTHAWRDLGVRYWPRFVLEGSCKTSRASCSVPPGMKCAPAERVLKVILRWQCSSAGSSPAPASPAPPAAGGPDGPQLHCQWMEINNFPIVTGCSCGCPSQNGSS